MECIKKYGGYVLGYASKTLQSDRNFALQVLENADVTDSNVVAGFSKEVRDDNMNKGLMLVAIKKWYDVIRFSGDIYYDREFLLDAVEANYESMTYMDHKFRQDREFMLEAVEKDGNALAYAKGGLKDDKKIVIAALRSNPNAIKYVDDDLKNDDDVLKFINKK